MSRDSQAGGDGGTSCRIEFRPNRFWGYHVEKILSEFFTSDVPELQMMPVAIRDLSQGTVRVGLDDGVLVEAHFSEVTGSGQANVQVCYCLPTVEEETLERLLALLERQPTCVGYYRFGRGSARPLRAVTRVKTQKIGSFQGEMRLMTIFSISLHIVGEREKTDSNVQSERAQTLETVSVRSTLKPPIEEPTPAAELLAPGTNPA